MAGMAAQRLAVWLDENDREGQFSDDEISQIVSVVLNLSPEDADDAEDILVGRFRRAIEAEFSTFMGLSTDSRTWRRVARGVLTRAGLIHEQLPDGRSVFVLEER